MYGCPDGKGKPSSAFAAFSLHGTKSSSKERTISLGTMESDNLLPCVNRQNVTPTGESALFGLKSKLAQGNV